ncbi:hypothetical protein [Halocella sp. SP3-1]|nr:hypothetical protein [Halocella sp. SP3-1]
MIIVIVLLFIFIIVAYHPYLERERNSYLLYIDKFQEKEKTRYKKRDIDY